LPEAGDFHSVHSQFVIGITRLGRLRPSQEIAADQWIPSYSHTGSELSGFIKMAGTLVPPPKSFQMFLFQTGLWVVVLMQYRSPTDPHV
jgi:hypothetical protein